VDPISLSKCEHVQAYVWLDSVTTTNVISCLKMLSDVVFVLIVTI
jgi:hypothetical protein